MNTFGFLGNIGATELLIVLAIVLLLFGSRKLPELSRSMATSVKELRKGLNEDPSSGSADAADTNNNSEDS